MKGRARQLYVKLARDLAVEGYACQADSRVVALCATTEAHAERLAAEVEKLDELVIVTDKGAKVHPLVAELRSTRAQLAALLDRLFLSPKARSTSRLNQDQLRQAALRGMTSGVGARDRSKARFFSEPDALEEFLNEGTGT